MPLSGTTHPSDSNYDSVLARRCPFPPAGWGPLGDVQGGKLDVGVVAELPELLGRTAELEDDPVDVERIEFAATKAINGHTHCSIRPANSAS
jgi:hypothetical protein